MKLLAGLAISLVQSRTPKDCDLSETGIFDNVGYGLDRYVYTLDYRIKTSGKLQNKGKVKQAAAELIHPHSDTSKQPFTDAWVACTDIEVETQYYIKCKNDGTFEIDGKSGSAIKLPDCTEKATTTARSKTTKAPKPTKAPRPTKPPRNSRKPKAETFSFNSQPTVAETTKRVYTTPSSFKPVKPFKQLKPGKGKKPKPTAGCDPRSLGPFGATKYNTSHGCKKGYESDGKEKKNNSCVRQCQGANGPIKTAVPVACYCKKTDCFYQIKLKKVGKLRWDAVNPETGHKYISDSGCLNTGALQMSNTKELAPVLTTCNPLENNDDKTVWACSNGEQSGSVCTKQCLEGYMNDVNSLTMTCDCGETCQWTSNNGSGECLAPYCIAPQNGGWAGTPGQVKCTTENGNVAKGTNFSPGTSCAQECPAYYQMPLNSMGGKPTSSTCQCTVQENRRVCQFSTDDLQECLPAVCDTDLEKLYGLDKVPFKVRRSIGHPYRIECEKTVPDGHELGGMAEYGSSCKVTCADGWRLEDKSLDYYSLGCGVSGTQFGWRDPGPYPKCARACDPIESNPLNDKEKQAGLPDDAVIWACNDSNFVGSVCQKSCAEGYYIKGTKAITSCYCRTKNCEEGPMWKGGTSNCRVNLLSRADEDRAGEKSTSAERSEEEIRVQMDEFIANIFGFR